MTKRKVLAAATLAALPMFIGASQSVSDPAAVRTETAHAWQMTDQQAGPQWAYTFGMEGAEALAFTIAGSIGCAFFGPVGGTACAITAAL